MKNTARRKLFKKKCCIRYLVGVPENENLNVFKELFIDQWNDLTLKHSDPTNNQME